MRVVATDVSKLLGVNIGELNRIAQPGEVFEITEERFKVLNGGNQWKAVFAIKYTGNEKVIEEAVNDSEPIAKNVELDMNEPVEEGRAKTDVIVKRKRTKKVTDENGSKE